MMGAATAEAALDRARTAIDERFGIVRQLLVHDVGPSDPAFFFATAQLASTLPFSDGIASPLNGGAGLDRATAMLGALGEAIERYAIGIYRQDELLRAPFRDVERVAADPRTLVFFADEQYEWDGFPYVRVDDATPISWVRGTSLLDGTERVVPAARVFTPYRAPRPGERLMQSTSTGAASHVTHDQAILAALYECIERDAVMIAWLNELALPILDPTTLEDRELERALERCREHSREVRLFDATSDLGVPTVLSIVSNPPGVVPSLAVGAATRATFGGAAAKALIESAHTLFWIRTRYRDGRPRAFRDDYTDVTSLDLHSLLYGDPRMRGKVAFLSGNVPARVQANKAALRVPPRDDSPGAQLGHCLAALRRLDLEAIVIDVTPRDVADLGFVVKRVVVTELHQLWGGHHVRCLGGRRVADVPVRLGYTDRCRTPAELNRDPHPMP